WPEACLQPITASGLVQLQADGRGLESGSHPPRLEQTQPYQIRFVAGPLPGQTEQSNVRHRGQLHALLQCLLDSSLRLEHLRPFVQPIAYVLVNHTLRCKIRFNDSDQSPRLSISIESFTM